VKRRGAAIIPMEGRKFGRLLVIQMSDRRRKNRDALWVCRCDCGEERHVGGGDLRSGATTSCGCRHAEIVTTHGATKTPEYRVWASMWDRCSNPASKAYDDYGARGIRVAPEWRQFEAFIGDMGPRPSPRHTLERANNNKGYGPTNCRWATRKEQMNNTRANVGITFEGRTMNIAGWCKELSMHHATFDSRLRMGWSIEKIITTPVKKRTLKNA
jgi:hypothetical protein